MLNTREHGFSPGSYIKGHARRYLILILIFGLLLSVLAYIKQWPAFTFAVGMLLGSLLRDVAWVRQSSRAWPFTEKVTDWDIVQKLAQESAED
jgi:hypothetical protein